MTRWQEIALGHVCMLAIETVHPRFRHLTRAGSVVLTVNSGYE